ncbi:MAG: multiubiquitin domain-containing protein [Opitutaceae bacterium]|nr:multiubiquitin domain-containing protein [Opitutaceae bacterium]
MTQTTPPLSEFDDLAAAVCEGRPLRPARAYRIEVADDTLSFRTVEVADPIPLGRQILEAAGARPVEEFSVFAILASGDFEDVRLNEPFDLRGHGAERFVVFRTDREFKFTIDNCQLEWGKAVISGAVLRRLADVKPGYALYLEVRGGQDREIGPNDLIDLSTPGIERFITVLAQTTEGQQALPSRDRDYLQAHGIDYQLSVDVGTAGVVLRNMQVPAGKYNHEHADVLILLPNGYPDVCPDMFFLKPWLQLQASGRYPTCADVAHGFAGQQWQRWSRHSSEWRPGIDGLHTMIARFRRAVEVAQ